MSRLLGEGRVFEYWAHEACVIPTEDYPLYRPRMRALRVHHWYGDVIGGDPKLRERVLGEIRDRGPLGSRDFEGERGPGMWSPKPAKRMLEALWSAGELAVAGRRSFQRLYDLPERVIPAAQLDAPDPPLDTCLRALALRAVRARGVLTEPGVAEHYRVTGGARRVRAPVGEIVDAGELVRFAVEDGGPPLLAPRDAPLETARRSSAVLLSPFDNLLWDRSLVRRLFGFEHKIEVYKPAPERRYGYYVLPFLRGERLAGRADLKTDRRAGTLRVLSLHLEPRVRESGALRADFERALGRLAAVVGADTIETPWTSRRARSTRGRSPTPRRGR